MIWQGSVWKSGRTGISDGLNITSLSDPSSGAINTAMVDTYDGVVITLTGAGTAQTIANPTVLAVKKEFIVGNNDTSTHSITVNSVVIGVGEAQRFFWDGSAWLTLEAVSASQISFTPAGDVVATDVQSAIVELDSDLTSTKDGDVGIVAYENTQATTGTLTVAECSGSIISNYGQTAENTQTLPTCAKGLNGIVTIGTAGAGAFHLKAGPTDKIYLDGTALDDGDKVSMSVPTVGYFFSFFAFQTGATTYDWIIETGRGYLIDGGA